MAKKFPFYVFLLTALIYGLFAYISLYHKMLYMDREYPMWVHVKDIMNGHSIEPIDLLVLGDSRAKAGFMPSSLPEIKSLNLAVGGGTPVEAYYILEHYLKNNPPPKNLVFSFVGGHLSGGSHYWGRTVTFDFLSDNEFEEIEKFAREYNEDSILESGKSYRDYKYPKAYASNFKNGLVGGRWVRNKLVAAYLVNSGGHHYFGTRSFANGRSGDSYKKNFKVSDFQNFYFKKALNLALNNGIDTGFYFMPLNKTSFSKAKNNYIEEFTDYIENLFGGFGFEVCNSIFYMDNDQFGDPSHLYKGAKENTHRLSECIK